MRQVKRDIPCQGQPPHIKHLLRDTAEPYIIIHSSGALKLGYIGSNLSSATPRLGDLRQVTAPLHASVSSFCKKGMVILHSHGYYCQGQISSYTKYRGEGDPIKVR